MGPWHTASLVALLRKDGVGVFLAIIPGSLAPIPTLALEICNPLSRFQGRMENHRRALSFPPPEGQINGF